MRVVHLIGGGDEGGAKSHVLSLVQALRQFIDVSLVSFRKGPFHDDAITMGIDAYVIPTRGLPSDVRRALVVVQKSPCNLLHAHGAKGNLVGVILSRMTGIPLVTTVHSDYRLDYMHSLPKRLTYGLVNTVALRKIHHHISVSENFREMLTERGFDPQHIHAVYNGIPFDNDIPVCTRAEFFQKYHVPFPEDSLIIGIMARLHPVKDHETFLRACASVSAEYPQARFLIGGPGDLLSHLERFAENLGIRNKVHFAGMVTNPYDFFQIIDINVLTSISESFPYVILEGARFAKPTVSSRVGGLRSLFVQGENGFLFEPKDVKALSGYLKELCASESLRKRLGQQLYETARDRFSLQSMCQTQLSIYDKILASEKRDKQDGKKVDIVLLGYYGYKNSGDEAILKALTDRLRAVRPNVRIVVLSRNPSETRKGMKVAAIHRFNVLKAYRVLKKARLFIAGGGSLIQDNTSTRSIFYYLAMLSMAMKCGSRTMLLANGIGPITKPANRTWAGRVLNKLDAITLRDPDSLIELHALGVHIKNIEVTADPAVLLHTVDNEPALSRGLCDNGQDLIGFSIRKWSNTDATVRIVAEMADYCAVSYGVCPVFLPMQHPDDVVVSKRVIAQMHNKALLIDQASRPEVMMAFIGKLQFLVGMRLHSLIYAANVGVPMAGLVYEPKVSSFLDEVLQPVLCHIGTEDMTLWKERLDSAWENRAALKDCLNEKINGLRTAAEKNITIALTLVDMPKAISARKNPD